MGYSKLSIVNDFSFPSKVGNNFSIFVYRPFLTNKEFDKEDEEYMKKFDITLVYVKNPGELKKKLIEFNKN